MLPLRSCVHFACLALALWVVAVGTALAQGGKISEALRRALSSSGGRRPVRVLVRLHAPELPAVTGLLPATRAEARSRLARLKHVSETARKRLFAEMPRVQNTPQGRDANDLWLTNSVAVSADASTVQELAGRADVKSVQVLDRIPCPKQMEAGLSPGDDADFTWGLRRMHVPEIRALWGLTGKGVRVGHLDTGVAAEHPDLRGKVLLWKDFTAAKSPRPYDPEGHGTHTAATIVGGNASGRHIGMAPDARLISARIFSADGADPEEILAAMQWVVDPDGNPATDDGAHLVSNSWGSDDIENRVFWEAVQRWVELGVFPCFAAGNNGPATVGVPGGYPHAFAVGAATPGSTPWDGSSRGPTRWDGQEFVKPDIVAPGTEVLSAHSKGNLYQSLQGTSMACPHVSGLIALMLEAKRDLKVDEIRTILETTAEDLLEPGKDNRTGYGMVDPLRVIGRLVPSTEISGTVTGAAGQPVANAEVSVPRARMVVRADAQGRWHAVLPPGSWSVVTSSPGLAWGRAEVVLRVGQPFTHDVRLLPATRGALSGHVASAAEPRPLKARVLLSGTDRAPVETDPGTGAFTVELPEGRHPVLVVAPGFAPRLYPGVEVRAGATAALEVKLPPRPDVLLVDDDESDLLERYYTEALDRSGKTYSVWDTRRLGDPPRDFLLAYPLVIWQTGFDYQTAVTPAEAELVRAYLESGGHLYLAGQVAASTLRDTDFFAKTLHARFDGMIKREGGRTVPPIEGRKGDPIFDGVTFRLNAPGSQENQEFPTMIGPASAQASSIATYVAIRDPATPGAAPVAGSAAIRVDTGSYKLVYTGFGLDGISQAPMRAHLLGRILAWLAPGAEQAAARVLLVDASRERLTAAGSKSAEEYVDTTALLLEHARKEIARSRDRDRVLGRVNHLFGSRGARLVTHLRRARDAD